jgi:hypothetical protein
MIEVFTLMLAALFAAVGLEALWKAIAALFWEEGEL